VPLYYAVFEPGDLKAAFDAAQANPHPFTRMASSLGWPTQAVLNDPSATLANPSSITDFCTDLIANNSLLATVGGVTRATNPGTAGTHVGMNFTSGLRDTDNDGIENAFDTCPKNANLDNPRNDIGDDLDPFNNPAGDMLDPACDPTPSGTGSATNGNDHDNDTFPNAQDICPTVSNPTQRESESEDGPPAYDVSAIDGGPQTDSIGDDCDTGSITVTVNNTSTTYNFSPSVGNGHYHALVNPLVECYGGTDVDNDGYCAPAQDGADSGACASASPPNCTVRHASWTVAALSSLMVFDSDRGGGDTTTASPADPGGTSPFISCPGGATDVCPENGFDSDALETYVGTNAAQACPANVTPNNEPYDSWTYDFNDDTRANLSDVTAMGPSFNKFVNAVGGTVRTDINVDGQTNLSDVTAMGPFFNKQCRRDDGTLGPGAQ
jgi:hypothetical protein